ncbi:MAG: von Willebrand factor type A domain-containing protein [Spirochaetaceae bacterium]
MINKLKDNKPQIDIDDKFKTELKDNLISKASKMHKKRKVIAFHPIPAYFSVGIAAALVIFLTFPGIEKEETLLKSDSEIIYEFMEEAPVIKEIEAIPETETVYQSKDESPVDKEIKLVLEKTIEYDLIDEEEAPSYEDVELLSSMDAEVSKLYQPVSKKEMAEFNKSGSIQPSIMGSAETKWGFSLDNVNQGDLSLGYVNNVESNTEEYTKIVENRFLSAIETPLSTFSIDVDTASYANVRRYINSNSLPPKDSVRIEEMINYFNYDYPVPTNEKPFSIYTEISSAPWNSENHLVHIGIQGKDIPKESLPPSNIVFLIDVSGSMANDNKLGLLVKSVDLMLENFTNKDRIAVVAYAGAAGVVLPSTSGDRSEVILESFQRLSAGGSTAGAQGIELAYNIAMENFIPDGNNRVIIATDGDFNVGSSSTGDLTRLIEEKRDSGVFLTVLGFGMGNYKDSRMESLADSGNGNYAYIDSLLEAQKVLVQDIKKTLFVIAKDVKIQVEFNPAIVSEYRLIGYETRLLEDRDFTDDKVDAGDIGSGHTVTALYEVSLVKGDDKTEDNLRYQDTTINSTGKTSGEILTLSIRYKEPKEDISNLIRVQVESKIKTLENSSNNFKLSAAVAGYGQLLRGSEYIKNYGYDDVISMTKDTLEDDEFGYRSEFYTLLRKVKLLK